MKQAGLPPPNLLRDFLAWVGARPRTYRETMDAWRTSCPRLSVWEDATADGLVAIRPEEGAQGEQAVRLTALGQAVLDGTG